MGWPSNNLRGSNVLEHGSLEGSLECRECGVICERVVFPWRCLKEGRTCVYAFRDSENLYFGCLHKVFTPELEMDVVEPSSLPGGSRSDPYGALRVMRPPRPQCPVSVERAYSLGEGLTGCVNPLFVREAFRVHMKDDLGTRGDGGSAANGPLLG